MNVLSLAHMKKPDGVLMLADSMNTEPLWAGNNLCDTRKRLSKNMVSRPGYAYPFFSAHHEWTISSPVDPVLL
jgi:hypothetical protein